MLSRCVYIFNMPSTRNHCPCMYVCVRANIEIWEWTKVEIQCLEMIADKCGHKSDHLIRQTELRIASHFHRAWYQIQNHNSIRLHHRRLLHLVCRCGYFRPHSFWHWVFQLHFMWRWINNEYVRNGIVHSLWILCRISSEWPKPETRNTDTHIKFRLIQFPLQRARLPCVVY